MILAANHPQRLNGNKRKCIIMKLFLLALSFVTIQFAVAQSSFHKIAVFTPLFLDSVFDKNGTYLPDKMVARFTGPGLDFYLGAQLALDSLGKRGAPVEAYFFDTKSKESLTQQLAKADLNGIELMIGETNASETKLIAEIAQKRKIPFISATLPNDAGITNDAYLVILNSTLQTHVEGIYRYLQKYFSKSKIIIFRKSGAQEDQLKKDFLDFAKTISGGSLPFNYVDVGTNFSSNVLASYLDSSRANVCIAGSLDTDFGMKLAQGLNTIRKTYPITLIGMPTWDNLNLTNGPLNDLEIIYSTPFYYNYSTSFENQLASSFNNKLYARPSDMYFRGYETTLRFTLMLLDNKRDLASSLTLKGNNVFTQLDIQPVFKDKKTMVLDYFENKHLYFIKVFGGVKNIVY